MLLSVVADSRRLSSVVTLLVLRWPPVLGWPSATAVMLLMILSRIGVLSILLLPF